MRSHGAHRLLRAWVVGRTVLALLALVAVAVVVKTGGTIAAVDTEWGRNAVKSALYAICIGIYRSREIEAVLVIGVVLGLGLPLLRKRAWWASAAGAIVLGTLGLHASSPWALFPFLLLAVANLAPYPVLEAWPRLLSILVGLPGSGLLLLRPTVVGLRFLPPVPPGRSLVRLVHVAAPLLAISAILLDSGIFFAVDSVIRSRQLEDGMFHHWPERLLDPRITVIARSPENVRCEFHDVDVIGDRIVVVAEGSRRLLSFPIDGGAPATWELPPWWGPLHGLVLDSETDPSTGVTWYLDGPQNIRALSLTNGAWQEANRSIRLPEGNHHAYLRWVPELARLYVFSLNVNTSREAPKVIALNTPELDTTVRVPLVDEDGKPLPPIRDVEWMSSQKRFVLVPDFGTRMYLWDPITHRAMSWIEVYTLNGRPTYDPTLDRLFLPLPDLARIDVIVPSSGIVERTYPADIGVRTVAVDPGRDVLLSASVLDGRIRMTRLSDGKKLDTWGFVSPLVRELAIAPKRGLAFLTTWSGLYEIQYGDALDGR
jgi:hypothetical protein